MKREEPKFEPDPVIEAYKKDVDITLIRENLKLTVEERLRKLMRTQRFIEELRRATREASHDRLRESTDPAGPRRS
jgi:transposase